MIRLFTFVWLACLLSTLSAQQSPVWSLQRCLTYAREHNLAFRQAELNTRSAEIALAQSQAARMPSLNGSTNAYSRFGYFVDPFTNTLQQQTSLTFDAGLQAGVTLYAGGRITHTIRQRELGLAASEADLANQEQQMALDIVLAYLSILQNEEVLESARTQLASTREQRDRTEKLVRAGSAALADLLQVDAQIATEELNVVNAQNQVELSYIRLQQLMNLDLGEPFSIEKMTLADPQGEFMAANPDEVYRYAEANQPSVRSAELSRQGAEAGVAVAKSAVLPTLSAFSSVGTGYSTGRQLTVGFEPGEPQVLDIEFNGVPATISIPQQKPVQETYAFGNQIQDNVSANVSVGLSIPIYNRRQTRSNIEQAEITLESARYTTELARQQLKQVIEQAYFDARSAYSRFEATRQQLSSAEVNFQNVEKQFNVGLANSLDYLVAKNNVNRARYDLVNAKYTYLFRIKVLDFYQGKPLTFN
ncbi:MAG: TolC family protein [Bacteroidia bacterium]|nr:TolC family protein [Bacteroidia bacterium]